MFHLLGLAGATGSGKDTVIDEVLIPLGYVSVRTSDILKSEILKRFPKITDTNLLPPTELARLGKKIRRDFGGDYFTQLAMQKNLYEPNKIVNGLRRKEEFDAIHEAGGQVILVISDISRSVRRVVEGRQRASDMVISRDEILAHIKQEKENLEYLRKKADLVLWNEFSTREKFVQYARALIMSFLEQEDELG